MIGRAPQQVGVQVRVTLRGVDQEVCGSSPPSCTNRSRHKRACSSGCLRSAWRLSRAVARRISTNARSLVRRRGSRLLYLNAIGPSGSEATLAIVDYHPDMRPHPSR